MARKKRKDWPEIEQEWAVGQLSRCEIARRFKVDRKTVNVHMAEAGIKYGSLADDVRRQIQAKLVSSPGDHKPTGKPTGKPTPPWDSQVAEDIISRAIDRGVVILESHRDDLREQYALKKKAEGLVHQIKLPTDNGSLTLDNIGQVKLYADTVGSLVRTSSLLIDKERQAFNLDVEKPAADNSKDFDGIPEQLADMFK